jgi:hypothetical protein
MSDAPRPKKIFGLTIVLEEPLIVGSPPTAQAHLDLGDSGGDVNAQLQVLGIMQQTIQQVAADLNAQLAQAVNKLGPRRLG